MSFSHSSLSAQVKSYLTFLPEEIRQKILEHLHSVIHYEPVIGIMGKSGTGKSSLCNAIFQSHICATHPLNGCTRQAHRLTLQIGERRMTLVDLPGIGETPQHDQEYRALYRQLLPEVDLIIWILRADERAYAADITMHQFLLNEGADPSRFLFVLSHADRAFPAEEWNATEKCPSRQQALSLATVTARVATLFPSSFPVLSVAAPVGWNLPAFVSLMIHALPPQATSAVYSHIRGENRSEQAQKHAQQTFGETIGKSFDVAVAR
ncbi:TPA: 50S ribosome-binding GTPase, partial [Escherichia coli]|nr:50S ribosome-binding GTPase [Escherichia coli]MCN8899417.1 50S ribosome-binding GTPase [Escherichia coli]MCN9897737.1 50S ribosome-binding GTPase [Escherichia coli]HBD3994231.1 50S ribosome-binding GTPase [Escherichia coli]